MAHVAQNTSPVDSAYKRRASCEIKIKNETTFIGNSAHSGTVSIFS